jgi:hypothetical protein
VVEMTLHETPPAATHWSELTEVDPDFGTIGLIGAGPAPS